MPDKEQMMKDLGFDEQMVELAFQAQVFRVLSTIHFCNSEDIAVISSQIYRDFGGVVDLEKIQEITSDLVPYVLSIEEFFVDGEITPAGKYIAEDYRKQFSSENVGSLN